MIICNLVLKFLILPEIALCIYGYLPPRSTLSSNRAPDLSQHKSNLFVIRTFAKKILQSPKHSANQLQYGRALNMKERVFSKNPLHQGHFNEHIPVKNRFGIKSPNGKIESRIRANKLFLKSSSTRLLRNKPPLIFHSISLNNNHQPLQSRSQLGLLQPYDARLRKTTFTNENKTLARNIINNSKRKSSLNLGKLPNQKIIHIKETQFPSTSFNSQRSLQKKLLNIKIKTLNIKPLPATQRTISFQQQANRYALPPVVIPNNANFLLPLPHIKNHRFMTNAVIISRKTKIFQNVARNRRANRKENHNILLGVQRIRKNSMRGEPSGEKKKNAIDRPRYVSHFGHMLGINGEFVASKRNVFNFANGNRWDEQVVPAIDESETTSVGFPKNTIAVPGGLFTAAVNEDGPNTITSKMDNDESKAIETFMKTQNNLHQTGTSKSCIENGRNFIASKCGDQIIDHTAGSSVSSVWPLNGQEATGESYLAGISGGITSHKIGGIHHGTRHAHPARIPARAQDQRMDSPFLLHADGIPAHIKHDINAELSHANDPRTGIISDSSIQNYQEFDPFRGLNYGMLNQLQDDPTFDEMEYKLSNQPVGLPRGSHHVEHDRGSAYHSVVEFHHGGIFHKTEEANRGHGEHGTVDILGSYIAHSAPDSFREQNDGHDNNYYGADGDGLHQVGDGFHQVGDSLHQENLDDGNNEHNDNGKIHDRHDSNSLEHEAIEHKIASFSQSIGHPFVSATHSGEDDQGNNGHFGAGEVYMHEGLFPGSRMHDAVGLDGNHGSPYNSHELSNGGNSHESDYNFHDHESQEHEHNNDFDNHSDGDHKPQFDHEHDVDHDFKAGRYQDPNHVFIGEDEDYHHGTDVMNHHLYHRYHGSHHEEDESEHSKERGHTYNIGGSIVHAVGDPFAGLEYSFNTPILNHPAGSGLGTLGPLIAAGGGATGGPALGGGDGTPPVGTPPGGSPPGGSPPGGSPPGSSPPGETPPGGSPPGSSPPGSSPPGGSPPGSSPPGSSPPGSSPPGSSPPGSSPPGSSPPGGSPPGSSPPGGSPPDGSPPGSSPPGGSPPGGSPPGGSPPGGSPSAGSPPGGSPPGGSPPGTSPPGRSPPGGSPPGSSPPGSSPPDSSPPGGSPPGSSPPGSSPPDSSPPGGSLPSSSPPGGSPPGGSPPGSSPPGGSLPGGSPTGGSPPGGSPPGGSPPSGSPPGGSPPGGSPPSGSPPGGSPPGSSPPSGSPPSGSPPGGSPSGGSPPGSSPPGKTPPGGTPPGSSPPGGTSPSGSSPSGSSPGRSPPAGSPPGGSPPSSSPPGASPPSGASKLGGTQPGSTPPGGSPTSSSPPGGSPPSGASKPGGTPSGGSPASGASKPGGTSPGGSPPGGSPPGSYLPGGSPTSGASKPGGTPYGGSPASGASKPGDTQPGGSAPSGASKPGGTPTGDPSPGGTPPTKTPSGTSKQSGTQPGGSPPGGTSPVGSPSGSSPPGGRPPGNTPSGASKPGSTPLGDTSPGGTSPGDTPSGGISPGDTPPGGTSPGDTSPGGTSPADIPTGGTSSGSTPPGGNPPANTPPDTSKQGGSPSSGSLSQLGSGSTLPGGDKIQNSGTGGVPSPTEAGPSPSDNKGSTSNGGYTQPGKGLSGGDGQLGSGGSGLNFGSNGGAPKPRPMLTSENGMSNTPGSQAVTSNGVINNNVGVAAGASGDNTPGNENSGITGSVGGQTSGDDAGSIGLNEKISVEAGGTTGGSSILSGGAGGTGGIGGKTLGVVGRTSNGGGGAPSGSIGNGVGTGGNAGGSAGSGGLGVGNSVNSGGGKGWKWQSSVSGGMTGNPSALNGKGSYGAKGMGPIKGSALSAQSKTPGQINIGKKANENQNCVCKDRVSSKNTIAETISKMKRHIITRNCICDTDDDGLLDNNEDEGYIMGGDESLNEEQSSTPSHRKKKKKKSAHNLVNFVEKIAGKFNVDKLNIAEELVQNLKKQRTEKANLENGVTTIKEATSDNSLETDEFSKLKKTSSKSDESPDQSDIVKDITNILSKKQQIEDSISTNSDVLPTVIEVR